MNDIFVHDRETGVTTRVSVDSAGVEANSFALSASISGDGRYIAFFSDATNLVAGDSNGVFDIFVHDVDSGETVRVSVSVDGIEGNQMSVYGVFSSGGRYLSFESYASNLVPGDTNGDGDIFVVENLLYSSPDVEVREARAIPSIGLLGMLFALLSVLGLGLFSLRKSFLP